LGGRRKILKAPTKKGRSLNSNTLDAKKARNRGGCKKRGNTKGGGKPERGGSEHAPNPP